MVLTPSGRPTPRWRVPAQLATDSFLDAMTDTDTDRQRLKTPLPNESRLAKMKRKAIHGSLVAINVHTGHHLE